MIETHPVVRLSQAPGEFSAGQVGLQDLQRDLSRRRSTFEGERVGETAGSLGESELEVIDVGGGREGVGVGVVRRRTGGGSIGGGRRRRVFGLG